MQPTILSNKKLSSSKQGRYTFNSTIGSSNGFNGFNGSNGYRTTHSNNNMNSNHNNIHTSNNNYVERCPSSDILIREKKMADLLSGSEKAITNYNSNIMRFSHMNMFNSLDIDKLKDEILKLKQDNNNKKKEVAFLKIENSRLEEDNKKNIKVIEEVLRESGKSAAELINSIINKGECDEEGNCIQENKLNIDLSPNNFIRLREIYVINSLKKQISAMKQIIQNKEEEIETYKSNSKVMKFAKLEFNFNNKVSELNVLKREYESLKTHFDDNFRRLKDTTEERDYCKSMMIKFKAQYEEAKNRVKSLEEEVKALQEIKKTNEEKIIYMSKCSNNNAKVLLKEKENELANLRTSGKIGENANNTQKKLENKIQALTRENRVASDKLKQAEANLRKLKEDYQAQINKLHTKITQVEKENFNFRKINSEVKKENQNKSEEIQKLSIKIEEVKKENEDFVKNTSRMKTNSELTERKESSPIVSHHEDEFKSMNHFVDVVEDKEHLNIDIDSKKEEEEASYKESDKVLDKKQDASNDYNEGQFDNYEPEAEIAENEVENYDNNKEEELDYKLEPEPDKEEIHMSQEKEFNSLENENLEDNPEDKSVDNIAAVLIPKVEEDLNKIESDTEVLKEEEFIDKEEEFEVVVKEEPIIKAEEEEINSSKISNPKEGKVYTSISKMLEERSKENVLFKTAPEVESNSPQENVKVEEGGVENKESEIWENNTEEFDQDDEENKLRLVKKQTTVKDIEKEIISPEIIHNSPKRKNQSVTYLIQVCESEPQVINYGENFYIKNTEDKMERRKKSCSVIVRDPLIHLKRAPTIDRVLTEKILGNMDIDAIFEDSTIKKFFK